MLMSAESGVLIVVALIGLLGAGVYSFFKLRADAKNAVADSADRTIKIISAERDELQHQLDKANVIIKGMQDTHAVEISSLKEQVGILQGMITQVADVAAVAGKLDLHHTAAMGKMDQILQAVTK